MANVPAQGIKSYGVWAGCEGASNEKLIEAWNIVLSKRPAKPQPVPLPVNAEDTIDTPGVNSSFDMPIYEKPDNLKYTSPLVDIADDVEVPVEMKDIIVKHKAGNYNELPGAFGFHCATEIPITMDLSISRKTNGKLLLVKHVQFIKQERVSVVAVELVKGIANVLHWVPERLPGFKLRHWGLEKRVHAKPKNV